MRARFVGFWRRERWRGSRSWRGLWRARGLAIFLLGRVRLQLLTILGLG